MSDSRDPQQPDRRVIPRGGRRESDKAWSTNQLAEYIGMSRAFVVSEIHAREIVASQFGREWRIHIVEVQRYLSAKGFPLPTPAASENPTTPTI